MITWFDFLRVNAERVSISDILTPKNIGRMFFLGAWHLTTHVVDMVDFMFCCAFLPGESSVGGIHVDAFLGFSNACESAGQLDSSGQSYT